MTYVIHSIDQRGQGSVEVTGDGGRTITEKCVVLGITVLDADTEPPTKEAIVLVIPRSVGPQLLQQLLTPEQFDAAMDA